MIISPIEIAAKGVISNILEITEQIQSNGIDLTLRSIQSLDKRSFNRLTSKARVHGRRDNVEFDDDGDFVLREGIYDILFNEKIEIPNGMCANIYTRSTLNRGGNFITAGLYDAGYKGPLGAMLHVNIPIVLEKGVRLAQIVFSKAKKGEMYDGIYNKKTVA